MPSIMYSKRLNMNISMNFYSTPLVLPLSGVAVKHTQEIPFTNDLNFSASPNIKISASSMITRLFESHSKSKPR